MIPGAVFVFVLRLPASRRRLRWSERRNFLDCVKTRKDPYFPVEVGHAVSTLMHMGNISMRLGRKLDWDPAKEAFKDDDAANGMRSLPVLAVGRHVRPA